MRRGSLRIDRVTSADTGLYTCRAESQAGTSVASASLTVHCKYYFINLYVVHIYGFHNFVFLALPHFTRMPSDQTAWEGEAVSFPCEAEGSPKPLIFWTMEGSQVHLPTHY